MAVVVVVVTVGGGGDATTTSTTTSTTSTTSTTVPPTTTTEAPSPQTVNASWTSTSRSTSGTNWRASAELRVRDDLGDPVRGAVVTVRVQTRRGTGSWTNRDTLQATTGSAGSLTFLSGWYPRSGSSRADQVRFTVLSVSAPGLDYVSGSIAVTVDRP